MKKLLVSSLIFVVTAISFTFTTTTFATNLSSYSTDVTVGEVDKIDTEEYKDVDTPQTGMFGSDVINDSVMVTSLVTVPLVIFFVFMLRYVHRKKVR